MRYLGLDVGSKTIGLAVGDADSAVATPLSTLERHGGARDIEAVRTAAAEAGADALVLGLPLTMEGSEGLMARRVRRFGDALAAALELPVHYADERFSTVAAERALLEADVSRARRKQVVDHVAATLILQTFLDAARAAAAARGQP
ncbi:MAG: Holliday junction resolvase RuvX [Myxococcales bacterium]|nr:Holliday junction resolvase RuvX [Myxococcales bacterium]